ncbi:Alpha-muurolene synthase [Grifola frondosa]|uniref:Alpha-muurolene synthase n=1 Tax=Grifola frondosa TaxID=5627 RepID=A0A1C7MAB4_GRIFR|nr:Alpha-muurolene synthase [Grifola frondosa]
MAGRSVRLPDLIAFCSPYFELRSNHHCRTVTVTAERWALDSGLLDDEQKAALPGLHVGLLASLGYPTPGSLGVETAFNQIWSRLTRSSTFDWQKRFQRHLAAFRSACARAAKDNEQDVLPDVESYIALRSDSCGVKMTFDLIEYAGGLNLPQRVHDMPILRRLRQDAADIIAWSIDIASYARKHDRHSLVTVLMAEKRLTAQGALQCAGRLVKGTVDNFLANERLVPPLGDKLDEDVQAYVQGLRDLIVGLTHWLYETERFFGDRGDDVRASGWCSSRRRRDVASQNLLGYGFYHISSHSYFERGIPCISDHHHAPCSFFPFRLSQHLHPDYIVPGYATLTEPFTQPHE